MSSCWSRVALSAMTGVRLGHTETQRGSDVTEGTDWLMRGSESRTGFPHGTATQRRKQPLPPR